MSFKQVLWLMALGFTLQTMAVSPSLQRLQDESAKLAERNKVLMNALKEITAEEFVGQKFDRCAKRTMCVAECVADDESRRFECLKNVCPKELCVEEESVGQFDKCAKRSMCVAQCVADDESRRFECLKHVCKKELCVEEESVGQFDKCAKRSMCVAECVAEDESKRFECVKNVCPKELCITGTVAKEKSVGATGACRDTNEGGPPEGWHCHRDWEHVVWWNEMHTYCRSDKAGRGCRYGFFHDGWHDYCCMKIHWDLFGHDLCQCW